MTLRFPEVSELLHVWNRLIYSFNPQNPSEDEREALRAYLHLTSRLYPCGECAEEFQQLLKAHPPQVGFLVCRKRV
jgi:hypothetical protein